MAQPSHRKVDILIPRLKKNYKTRPNNQCSSVEQLLALSKVSFQQASVR